MHQDSKIYIAGHRGMVGRAIWRTFKSKGYQNLIGLSKAELDLRNQAEVREFFETQRPEVVIDAAAKVGGIIANASDPYGFLMENLQVQNNLIQEALKADVQSFVFLGSSCIYPKFAEQPLQETSLLTGALEPTNEAYAIAKIAGVKACEYINRQFGKHFISLMPTNLYGPYDNFDLEMSHVVPALIRKFHEAKQNNSPVEIWGNGSPMREFLYVDDLANAVLFCLENNIQEPLLNVGVGKDVSIKALATRIQSIVGHQGEILWDTSKPNGTHRKLLDVSKLGQLGWRHQTDLEVGLRWVYEWYLAGIDTDADGD